MYLYGGPIADVAPLVGQESFITACEKTFLRTFGFAAEPDEVRSWRRSWPALLGVLTTAGLDDLHILLEYSLPATGQRIDALVVGQAGDGHLAAVVIELKQWTDAQLSLQRPGMARIGKRTVLHPARQVGGYVRYLEDWVAREENPLHVRGLALLHDAPERLITCLRAQAASGPAAAYPLLGRDDIDGSRPRGALADRLGCADLKPAPLDKLTSLLSAEHRPSPKLLARAGKVIKGHDAFQLIGEQDLARQEVLHAVTAAERQGTKGLIVVTGGPGTGKTVIACRLLGDLCNRPGANPRLLSPSGTLTRQVKRTVGDDSQGLIATFLHKVPATVQAGSVVLLDEAHRARTYPDHQRASFPLILGKLIDTAAVTVLFLDEQQIIRPTEGVTVQELRQHADRKGLAFAHIDLTTQFRCTGSRAYQEWLNQFLEPHGIAPRWTGSDYDLAAAASPDHFTHWVEAHTSNGHVARICAGFCWPWDSPPVPPLWPEVEIPWLDQDGLQTWKRPWNSHAEETDLNHEDVPGRPFWATDPGGHRQVGCIYTAQGLEYDYNVVILGNDLIWHNDRWVAQPQASRDDQLRGLPPDRYLRYALNSYRVLATRGTRGTRFYSTHEPTQAYLQSLLDPTHP